MLLVLNFPCSDMSFAVSHMNSLKCKLHRLKKYNSKITTQINDCQIINWFKFNSDNEHKSCKSQAQYGAPYHVRNK